MSIEGECERLSQAKLLSWLNREMQATDMITVYWSDRKSQHDCGLYCALIPSTKIEKTLSSPCWDLRHGGGLPGTVEYWGNKKEVEYLRFGNKDGVEPLVVEREFHGIREDYNELSEEFRLFHCLYHDLKHDHYIKIDDAGNETLVAVVEPNRIQIRLKEIRQFLAVKEMYLSIQFDCREFSLCTLEELGLNEGGKDTQDGLLCWGVNYGDFTGVGKQGAFSRLLGKRLIPPLPKEKSGFYSFSPDEPKKYVDFIIGVDENGEEVTQGSDPDKLADNFGGNRGKSHYLTPVHFSSTVLDKYYQQPSKYSVEDGILRCGFLWSMDIDNHHDDQVCAWLGDLGRDIPYEEQLHWRSYNILPSGGMSETHIRRQLLCQFTDSDRPEHLFSRLYRGLSVTCAKTVGWQLLLPLAEEDSHCLQAIRIPSGEEQKDFDELVLALTKILVDSLNEKELNQFIPQEDRGDIKGSISRLERVFDSLGVKEFEEHIVFLRNLQSLRSSGTAHRKGNNYRKIAESFGVDNQSLKCVFKGILNKALFLLQFFIAIVRSGVLKKTIDIGEVS